jgi:crossover junction endodeoxyribonuclease RuvC
MLILGIDPGTARTGYGIIQNKAGGSIQLVEYGVIQTQADDPMSGRLLEIFYALRELIKKHQLESAAVEKIFFQRNVSTAMSVGQARGVVLLALAEAGLEIEEYTPNDIKLAITGYGSADKGQVQRMVKALLNLETIPKPDDAADALAVAICHLHTRSFNRRVEAQ